MTTMIPPTVYTQIVQTNSSPETIAALLNEAESRYSSTPRHFNQKRVYPFWKICQFCLKPFPCHTKEQATRNKTCSPICAGKLTRKTAPTTKKPDPLCLQCGNPFRPKSHTSLKKAKFCNGICYGRWRAANPEIQEHLKMIASKGKAGWTEDSQASYQQKMSGVNNPAWKGGVMMNRHHGNYKGAIYVQCPTAFLSMARKDGYVIQHRLMVAQAIGRPLLRTEVVHHINHNSLDNRIENLQLFANNSDHKRYERHGSPLPIWSL